VKPRQTLKVKIGKRVVEFANRDKNFWLFRAMKHVDVNIQKYNGRVTAKDLAKLASQMSALRITRGEASKFLKELFEPRNLEEVNDMIEDLMKGDK